MGKHSKPDHSGREERTARIAQITAIILMITAIIELVTKFIP